MSIYLYPYSPKSKSAKLLAAALPCKRIKTHNSRYQPNASDIIINWGASHFNLPSTFGVPVLNYPNSIRNCCNKLATFRFLNLNHVKTCDHTTSKIQAQNWLDEGYTVFGRDVVDGSGGIGIRIYQPNSNLLDHLFYTKYIVNRYEFRVHCFYHGQNNYRFWIQQKKKRNNWINDYGHLPNSKYIKNHDNGYVFVFNDMDLSPTLHHKITTIACNGLIAMGIEFGAFDIVTDYLDNAYILEVNTAPGIEGTTLQVYKENLLTMTNHHD